MFSLKVVIFQELAYELIWILLDLCKSTKQQTLQGGLSYGKQ